MTLNEVLEKVNQDSEMVAKIKAMKTPEEVYEFTKTLGLDANISFEEFKAEVDNVNDNISKLSEADVNSIGGGVNSPLPITYTAHTTQTTYQAAAV